VNVTMCMSLAGRNTPGLRVVTRDQLAQALHARTSPIIVWNSNLAAPFARLLWVKKLRWRFFAKLADMLIDDISHAYGVKFGDGRSVDRHTDGEIILTLGVSLHMEAPPPTFRSSAATPVAPARFRCAGTYLARYLTAVPQTGRWAGG